MSVLQRLYGMAPSPIKAVLLNAKSMSNHRKRFRDPYREILVRHMGLWRADINEVKEFQREQLIELLLEAYDHSRWYQARYKDLGVQRSDILSNPFAVLRQMPFLTKRERKVHLDELISRNPKRKIVDIGFTSGSTGEPTRVPRDQEAVPRTFALLDRYYWSIGVPERKRSVRLSGRHIVRPDQTAPPFWMHNWIDKQLLVSTYHLNEQCLPSILDKLNRFRPQFIDGYPSAAYIIGRYILERNLRLEFTPWAISSTAETLYPYQRDTIEKAFGCKVYNQYASGEGSPFISECAQGNLHLHLDTGVFEFFDKNGKPAKSGEIAEMVVTSFRNFLVPLIRYRIGDMVRLKSEQVNCECGCAMPTIESILGRDDDLTVTKSGALIGLATHRIFTGEEHIVRSQVIQPNPNELILRYVADRNYSSAVEDRLIAKAKAIYGQDMHITIQMVEDIPLGPNGKYRSVIRQFPLWPA